MIFAPFFGSVLRRVNFTGTNYSSRGFFEKWSLANPQEVNQRLEPPLSRHWQRAEDTATSWHLVDRQATAEISREATSNMAEEEEEPQFGRVGFILKTAADFCLWCGGGGAEPRADPNAANSECESEGRESFAPSYYLESLRPKTGQIRAESLVSWIGTVQESR